ncbi:ABC transporter ATP-binding protein [Streptomyces sp. NPDC095613]|uniref:ABC transporter ATP-binding protein n=1 Tax=Streptomyces sp. NPDC095613 TaxID=3155540 RepID=UPI003325A430
MNDTAETGRATFSHLVTWTRGSRRRLLFALVCALAGAGLGLAQPLIVDRTIEKATAEQPVAGLLCALAAVFFGQATLQAWSTYRLDQAGEGIVLRLRQAMIDQLLRLRMAVHDRQRLGDLVSRTTADTTLLRDVLATDVVNAVVNSLVVIGGVGMMVWLDQLLAAVVMAVVIGSGAIVAVVLKGIRRETVAAQEATGALAADLERVLSAIRTVRVNRAESRESKALAERNASVYGHNVRAARLSAVVSPAIELAVQGSLIVVIVVGLSRVSSGRMTVGELVAFLLYVNYLAVPMSGLFDIGPALQTGIAALQRVQGVLDLPGETDRTPRKPTAPSARVSVPVSAPLPATGPTLSPATAPALPPDTGLALHGVRFRYTDREILKGVSFHAPRNSCTAIAGPSGAGKSTVFSLLGRFYEPTAGTITLDGRNAHTEHTLGEWRARIGLVEQDSPLMYGTLRDNLTYAAPDAEEAWLDQVVEMAGLTALIKRLPQGLDAEVGEHGSALSGGEQQRVAIARSLLARPEILLLDEPTSHLDAAHEQVLARTLRGISAECTVLVIAHRLSTIKSADRVVVLTAGHVVASGDYDAVRSHLPAPHAAAGTGRLGG